MMLDITKRVHFCSATVESVRKALRKVPANARVHFNGNAEGYLHVAANGKYCCFDESDLAETYDVQEEAITKVMDAVAEFGQTFFWSDNDVIYTLVSMGITEEDFIKRGKGDFVKEYFAEE